MPKPSLSSRRTRAILCLTEAIHCLKQASETKDVNYDQLALGMISEAFTIVRGKDAVQEKASRRN